MRFPTQLDSFRTFINRPTLALATLAGLSGVVQAAERTERPPTALVAAEDDGQADDLVGNDDGTGPDPGVDALDPADDLKTELDPFKPVDDLELGETGQDLWLTAANPWHSAARLKATRVFGWNPNPVAPVLEFKVDPSLPLDANAKLELQIDALPGFDYDVYFCIGWETLTEHGGSLRIAYDNGGGEAFFEPDATYDYTPESYCDAWGAVAGPDTGRVSESHTITLGIGSMPDDTVTWQVMAVRVIATPRG